MSQKAFISEADAALANVIWNGIKEEFEAKNIVSSQEQISFSSPKAAGTHGTRKLSIFLYNITHETSSRNVALHYLVTPFTGNDKDDHALLEKIIHILLAAPITISSEEKDKFGLAVKIDSFSLEELSKLWLALGTPLRLSLSLAVSSAEPIYDSQSQVSSAAEATKTTAFEANPVTQLSQAVLKTFTEQSTGWRNRNMFAKQWVLQDFKKYTDMTVEEMQTTLNSLGYKLEQHGSTAQFIEPLNLLAGYYKHQLEQLKGMQKVSHNQSENLETIDAWIKEVEALVEALGR